MNTAIGIIGLGTMGASIARNALHKGVKVSVYNRTQHTAEEFAKDFTHEGSLQLCTTYKELIESLPKPRVLLLMVKAGAAVDAVYNDLEPLLEPGDIVIDGGNSNYKDTNKRALAAKEHGIEWVGLGISGGEEGALRGPSMMPGCTKEAWSVIQTLLEPLAAKDFSKMPCIAYLGQDGVGHFVKMVHNGIEYAIMQLIAESYDILKQLGNYSNSELAEVYTTWQSSVVLKSFLLEITADIFNKSDPEASGDIIDKIVDTAAQKGTGKWTSQFALDYGVAVPTINAAVTARILSGSTELRKSYQEFPYSIDDHESIPPKNKLASQLRNALEQSVVLAYLQGFELIQVASKEEQWTVECSEVARIWQGGCIIRSSVLGLFERLYTKKTAQAAKEELWQLFATSKQLDWRRIVQMSVSRGVPVPALYSALQYLDTLEQSELPQSLIQAQRDFFGAHTFKRKDKPGDFHIEW